MTPTEEICTKLDKLGVEYDTYDLPNGEHGVSWIDGNDIEWEVVQQGENFRIHALQLVTPEQVIAATVGAGTCKIDFDHEASRQCQGPIYRCDSCGVLIKDIETSEGKFKHCPNCGRRIEASE